jgi:SAM-dependent methyltransferase
MLVGVPSASFKRDEVQEESRQAHRQLAALKRFFTPRSVFMHLGAAECTLALQAAGYVERVYAIDPDAAVLRRPRLPSNMRFVFCGAAGIAMDPGTVDVAFSNALAPERLAEIRRSLAPRGVYVFEQDESADEGEQRARLLRAGFARVRNAARFALFGGDGFLAASR